MYNKMKFWGAVSLVLLSLFASGPVVFAGGGSGEPKSSGGLTPDTNVSASEKENIDEYVALLREKRTPAVRSDHWSNDAAHSGGE